MILELKGHIICVHQLTLRAIKGLLERRWITQETLKKNTQSRGFGRWKPQTSVAKLVLFASRTKEESLMPRLGINAALSSFFHVAIKIYNKQKKNRLLLDKSQTPSGSHCRLLYFVFFPPSVPPQNPLLFTLQQSLLYARPPLRQSPAQPCTVARGSHHFQVRLHCFPCFRSQRDQTINRQLTEKKEGALLWFQCAQGWDLLVCLVLKVHGVKTTEEGKQVPWHLEQLTLPLLSPVSVVRTISWLFTLIDFAGICRALDI